MINVILLMNQAEDQNQGFADRKCSDLPRHRADMHKGTFRAAGAVNDWLRHHKFTGQFAYCYHGGTFALASQNVDLKLLSAHLHTLPWLHPQDVQLLVKEPDRSRYEMWQLDLAYFKDVQEFLASSELGKPEVRAMLSKAIIMARQEEPPPDRRIRLEV